MKVEFATEREARVETVAQAVEALGTTLSFEQDLQMLCSLGIDDQYHIHQDGRELQPTEWAFKHFLGQLGVPYRFGMRIPNELLDIIVNRLRNMGSTSVRLLTHDSTLINVVPTSYVPPSLSNVLTLFEQTPVDFVRLSDRGTQLASTTKKIVAEPKKGDIVRVGIALNASETGGPFPFARLMTYRLVCTNGAEVGDAFGVAKWDRRIRGDGFDVFRNSIERLLERSTELVPILNALPERPVSVKEFQHLWLQSSRFVGKDGADALFDVDEERRKELTNAARARLEVDTGMNAYDVFNALSQCARDLPHVAGLTMQNVAGQMLRRN